MVGTITEHQPEDGNPFVKVAHGEFVREAHAAVHLDGFMADVPGLLANEGARGRDVGPPVGTFRRRRELQETHGLLDAGIAINDPVLQDLKAPIGWPNCLRVRRYSAVMSKSDCMQPTASAHIAASA